MTIQSFTPSTIWTISIRSLARSGSVRAARLNTPHGYDPHWRGIYDAKGRLVVAICHDMDLGDSWEHADNPEYPQKFSAMGIRIGVDYVTYAMTH